MNIPGLQRNDMLLQAGTAQRAEAPASDVSPAVTRSPGQIVDDVETSLLSDIKALIAEFNRDLDEIAGAVRAAGQGTVSITPDGAVEEAAPPVQQTMLASLAPESAQTTMPDATTGTPLQRTPQSALHVVFKVLLAKAEQFINTVAGSASAARSGRNTAGIPVRSAVQGQPLPGSGDAPAVEVPAVTIPGPVAVQEDTAAVQAGGTQIPDAGGRPAVTTGMGAGAERRIGTAGAPETAPRADAGETAAAPVHEGAAPATTEQAPATPVRVPAGAATPLPADTAGPAAFAAARAGTIADTDTTETGAPPSPSTLPSSTSAGQAEQTASHNSDNRLASYGRPAAGSFGAAYGTGQTTAPDNEVFRGPGAGIAAPAGTSAAASPAVDNNAVVARVAKFVEAMNALISTGPDETAQGEGVLSGQDAEARQTSPVGGRTVHGADSHAPIRQVLAEVDALQDARSIGISVEKDGLMHLDGRQLLSSLSSDREETIRATHSVANAVSDKVDSLANVLAAVYMSYNRPPQMTAVRGSGGTSSPEQEMTEEQTKLEQRLTELRLLIEKSEFLTLWIQGRVSDDAEFPEALE